MHRTRYESRTFVDLFWSLPSVTDLFGKSDPLKALFDAGQVRRYEAGGTISDPEACPHRTYYCRTGTIKVSKILASGREILITILQAGSMWSDRAVINGYWREVFLEAMEPSEIVAIENEAVERTLRARADLLNVLMVQISMQVSDALTLLDDFRGRDVASRLARVLVRFSNQYGVKTESGVRIDLPVTHQDLANMIGTARETVSRNMARFRRQGLVSDGHASHLEIMNLGSLEALIL
jgi:CRP/FNR family transcriptional regulator